MATNVGGGILGLPFAFYRTGLVNGMIVCLAVALSAHLSSMMYLKVKDLMPRRYESIYEIAY